MDLVIQVYTNNQMLVQILQTGITVWVYTADDVEEELRVAEAYQYTVHYTL